MNKKKNYKTCVGLTQSGDKCMREVVFNDHCIVHIPRLTKEVRK